MKGNGIESEGSESVIEENESENEGSGIWTLRAAVNENGILSENVLAEL